MARWITDYISPLGNETLWIEGQGTINNTILTFVAKFWWFLSRYRLILTALYNVLT